MSEKRELTRAEQVRARRAQRASHALTQTPQRPLKPVAHVTSRVGASYVQPNRKQAGNAQNNRRRFDVVFEMPHFTLRKAAIRMPRWRGNWRIVSSMLVVVFGAAIYLAWTLPYFRVPAVTALGNERLSREEIEAALGIIGQPIFVAKPDEMTARLRLNYPELASAEVNVYLPNYVYVRVSERKPVILWQQGEGFTWIDATGVAFRPHGQANGLASVVSLGTPPVGVLPLDDSLNPAPYIQKDLVDAILVLAPNVPAGSILTYDPNNGLGWRDSRGWNVFFGTSAKDMSLKLRVYQALVDSLVGRDKFPEYINVAYPDAPYYRMSEYAGSGQ